MYLLKFSIIFEGLHKSKSFMFLRNQLLRKLLLMKAILRFFLIFIQLWSSLLNLLLFQFVLSYLLFMQINFLSQISFCWKRSFNWELRNRSESLEILNVIIRIFDDSSCIDHIVIVESFFW